MAEPKSISVKLYLPDGRIRRFSLDNQTSSAVSLIQKINNLQPEIDNQRYQLCWRDQEGDMIGLSSDEELSEAMKYLENNILRIFVIEKDNMTGGPNLASSPPASEPDVMEIPQEDVGGASGKTGAGSEPNAASNEPRSQPETDENDPDKDLHRGVVCDGCDGEIRGNRFKCMVCPDYDLCASCDAKNLHTEHPMVKLTSPGQVPGRGGRWRFGPQRMRRMHRYGPWAWANAMGGCPPPPPPHGAGAHPHPPPPPFGAEGYWGTAGPWGGAHYGPCGHFHRGRFGGSQKYGKGGPGSFPYPPGFDREAWAKWWREMMSGINSSFSTASASAGQAFSGAAGTSTSATSEGGNKTKTQEEKQEAKNQEAAWLYTVGDQVADILGSMGINVDVDVEERPAAAQPQPEAKEAAAADAGKDKKNEKEEKMDTAEETPVKEKAAESKDASPSREGDWTFVGEKASAPPAYEETEAKATTALLYPKVPTNNTDVIVEEKPLHPDPKIASALKHMLNMGFINEGGWLTALLENKNGDISAVLDILQPVRKN